MSAVLQLRHRDDEQAAALVEFERDLLAGLRRARRSISPKYFYDARGSALFDQICLLDEYYPTRTEMGLLSAHADEMAALIGPRAEVVELGAGSLQKIRLLLPALRDPVQFTPVDISADHLVRESARLRREFTGLRVEPLSCDFSARLDLPPAPAGARRRVGFFPGSSLGNFAPAQARRFLAQCAQAFAGGGLLIGVDLVKHPERLHRAYNDRKGVTAAFNRNVLVRANQALGADFDVDAFDHYAFYQPRWQRIEMHLVSSRAQEVRVAGEIFHFEPGRAIHTENSYKFTVPGFQAMAREAGWRPAAVWVDEQALFSVHWLEAPAAGSTNSRS